MFMVISMFCCYVNKMQKAGKEEESKIWEKQGINYCSRDFMEQQALEKRGKQVIFGIATL